MGTYSNDDFSTTKDLERRFQELERRIRERLPVDAAPTTTTFATAPPRVSGLTVTSGIGILSFRWNSVTVQNLLRYEIQIATDANFTQNVEKFDTRNTNFIFDSISTTTYYARVRAVTVDLQLGEYSPTVNSSTGLVSTEDIEKGAITGPGATSLPSEFTTDLINVTADDWVDLATHTQTFDGNEVLVVLSLEHRYTQILFFTGSYEFYLRLRRDDQGPSQQLLLLSPTAGIGDTSVAYSILDIPSAQTHTYRLQARRKGSGTNQMKMAFSNRTLGFLETKR